MKPTSIDFAAPFDVQIAQARAQGVKLAPAYYALSTEKRAQAFTASGLAKLDQVQAVADALAKAQANGDTLADFKKWAKTQDWQLPKHRLETIYRNSAQTAYQAGHWRDFEENAARRPYLMYDAVNDSRVRPSHLALDGIIKPVGDPFWKTHAAPMGHRCRCTLRSLSHAEAMAKGGVTENAPAEGRADEGWGGKPADGFKGLLNSIENRLSKCRVNMAVTFAKARDNAPMWCKDGLVRDQLLMQKAWTERKGAMSEPRELVLPELPAIQKGDEGRAFSSHSVANQQRASRFQAVTWCMCSESCFRCATETTGRSAIEDATSGCCTSQS
jgi:SPP1 gp7 family putative phage head morphogenesis protein